MSRKRKKRGECVYCGKTRVLTRDHIPPKSLFGSPRPSNLVSIPCCKACNADASKDDEYFKNALVMRIDSYNHPDVQKLLPSVVRSYRKPTKIGYRNALLNTLRQVELRTPSGLYAGTTGAYDVDMNRLNKTVTRIVRGLFYTERGVRLPESHMVAVYSDWQLDGLAGDQKSKLVSTITAPLMKKLPKVIGEETFTYRFQFFEEDPFMSVWLMRFYGAILYLALTLPRVFPSPGRELAGAAPAPEPSMDNP
jgi:hypothetical protein